MVTTCTVITVLMTWHVVVTSDMAMGGGIRWSSLVMWQWHWAWLLWFVEDGDMAVGKWGGNGRALVADRWSSLLLGPWQRRPF